jgi:hypothetical protein
MSYAPATKIEHSGGMNKATVLTGGNVMVTQGLGAGIMMKFDDWQILADGATISATRDAPLWNLPAQVGTKFRWTLGDSYRVAIMTDKGVLQVKSLINGEPDFKKTLFADEAAWRATLSGGTTESSLPAALKEKQRQDELFSRLSDTEKIAALIKRYSVRDECWESGSPAYGLQVATAVLEKCRDDLKKLTFEDDVAGARQKLNLNMKHALRRYHRAKEDCDKGDANKKPLHMARLGKSHIMATITDVPHVLTLFNGMIAASENRQGAPVTLFRNFAEFGRPEISVVHRGTVVNIS